MAQTQLTKGMYGRPYDRRPEGAPFGLICGQTRNAYVVHNGGWYNRAGEKLGWGDLSREDLRRIAAELENGELFIILSETNSFWKFVTQPGIVGGMSATKPDVEAPGREYVANRAMYIISCGRLYFVDRYGYCGGVMYSNRGLEFEVLSPAAANKLLDPTAP